MKILTQFTVVLNLYLFISFVEHKRQYFEKCLKIVFMSIHVCFFSPKISSVLQMKESHKRLQ